MQDICMQDRFQHLPDTVISMAFIIRDHGSKFLSILFKRPSSPRWKMILGTSLIFQMLYECLMHMGRPPLVPDL